jgi:hypothetical protein
MAVGLHDMFYALNGKSRHELPALDCKQCGSAALDDSDKKSVVPEHIRDRAGLKVLREPVVRDDHLNERNQQHQQIAYGGTPGNAEQAARKPIKLFENGELKYVPDKRCNQ